MLGRKCINDVEAPLQNPGGSSTGSATGVSVGFAPFSIGADTNGSLIRPATRAALYAIKPTIGLVPQHGMFPLTRLMDSAGPMAKTVKDLANLLEIMVDHEHSKVPPGTYLDAISKTWDGLKMGSVDFAQWTYNASILKPNALATAEMVKHLLFEITSHFLTI